MPVLFWYVQGGEPAVRPPEVSICATKGGTSAIGAKYSCRAHQNSRTASAVREFCICTRRRTVGSTAPRRRTRALYAFLAKRLFLPAASPLPKKSLLRKSFSGALFSTKGGTPRPHYFRLRAAQAEGAVATIGAKYSCRAHQNSRTAFAVREFCICERRRTVGSTAPRRRTRAFYAFLAKRLFLPAASPLPQKSLLRKSFSGALFSAKDGTPRSNKCLSKQGSVSAALCSFRKRVRYLRFPSVKIFTVSQSNFGVLSA